MAQSLFEQEKLEEAIAEFRAVIRLDPEDASGHFGLGGALRKQGQRDEAIEEFRKARDNARPGSDFAELIEQALIELDDPSDRREHRHF
jgi:tetratricopeptide (TPR) repeat protein